VSVGKVIGQELALAHRGEVGNCLPVRGRELARL
jgi:hypothetical protein